MKLHKYNEHIHYLTDEEDLDYDPNEIMELVGLPSGLYLTMFRKEYSNKLKEFITWSENIKMYTYRDKDYSKLMYILDRRIPDSNKYKPATLKNHGITIVNSSSSIITLLRHWGVEDYTINGNRVSVKGNVTIKYETFSTLPVIFDEVMGNFTITHSALETLINCPQYVSGDFNVRSNRIRSLEGGPKKVGKNYDCSLNYLKNLVGAPNKVVNFNCSNNNLSTLKGSPMFVEGDFDCSNNLITSFKDGPLSCKGHLNCQTNLIQSMEHLPFLVKSVNSKNNPVNDKS